jgi:hypothetical protein
MQQGAMPATHRGDLFHRLDHTGFVVRQHQTDQRSDAVAQKRFEGIQIDDTVRIHRHDIGTGGSGANGIVFNGTYNETPPGGHGMDRGRVRLGSTTGKHQILGLTTKPAGDHLARILHDPTDTAAGSMNRGRIADDFEGRQDGVSRGWAQGLAGIGVEVMHLNHSVQPPTVAG